MMAWLLRLFSVAVLAAFAAAVWYAGPLVGFDGSRPLETALVRGVVIAVTVVAVVAYYAFRFWQARSAQKALERAAMLSDETGGEAQVLEQRMGEAISRLKRSSGRRNILYEVPWYVIIGPPGAGKTTALVNSGLKFPLGEAGDAKPVAGVGGTRNCEWWFTDEAILIDTAGRYTTQESNRETDSKGWQSFLSLLKQNRPRQPINGVIVAFSLADLIALPREGLALHAAEIRNRLQEIRATLNIEFPVYMLFTKTDLVAGFMDRFGDLDETGRRKVWGATFEGRDRFANLAGRAPAEFDALTMRLSETTPDRLEETADPARRVAAFGFVAQFAALRTKILDLLGSIFDPTVRNPHAKVRGLYFSSGTQEGTPIDQLLGTMGRSFGSKAEPHLSGTGKSFFLHDLLKEVIFAEAGWTSFDPAADRNRRLARGAALAAVWLATIAALGAMGLSFVSNRALISATASAVDRYRTDAGPFATETVVADTDLSKVLGGLDALRNLPAGYGSRDLPVPREETFGFSQRPRLLSAAEITYRDALERGLRSRLLLQLEQTIQQKMADPSGLYEPLKIYLMLGGKAPKSDDDLIVSWMKRDWEQNRYPGPGNRAGRADLEDHLRAMLELDDDQAPVFELDKSLVESAQRSLGRMSVADRAATLIDAATAAASPRDFRIAERAGNEAELVFETTDGTDLAKLSVPGIYTYQGFHGVYLNSLASIARELVDDQWVFGPGGEQGGMDAELLRLGPELLDRYGKDFVASWNGLLDRLKLKSLSRGKPDYLGLSALASPSSPIRQLVEILASETALTRPPAPEEATGAVPGLSADAFAKGLASIGIDNGTGKSQSRAGAAFASASSQLPGAAIEAQFRPYQFLVAGGPGQRPIDSLVQNFRDIYQSLLLAEQAPAQAGRVNANLQLQIATLRANASRLPKPLARMIQAAGDDFENDAAETSVAQLDQLLGQTVTGPCQTAIADRYPFAGASADDVSMSDFVALFAPNGVIDRFFAQYLAPFVDMSGTDWQWKEDAPLGRELSRTTLRDFQLAAEIRNAFFPLGSAVPTVNITITPFSLNGDADSAVLEINGQPVQSLQSGNIPSTVVWPGDAAAGSASLSLLPELSGRESSLKIDGPWALKRLLDRAEVTRNGDAIQVRFVIGGRDVVYTIRMGQAGNPFTIPALSSFSCPTGL